MQNGFYLLVSVVIILLLLLATFIHPRVYSGKCIGALCWRAGN
ncbi:hypothetical protein JOC54_003142 [Alkalihalobacillus xiaoxiensis]|uniref:Uncharacterized protein n=1 Tax=Shouchella xiaoxiensis TaxID=766895 RepID=A0ABS2T052_9BACI|nr:hypothetical protein [Shouchella xiaoxiensis]MBM7839862.1 hypothetical protein [Shouchella xiaoxiensis]